ncbi:MAG TPA: hypothetical protein VFG83_13670 [Kofleriaceae bacterium]|nr:hypothetical protein [Kofleriaceae bacterium]
MAGSDERCGEVAGSDARSIEVAGVRFRFVGDGGAMALVGQRYESFLCAGDGAAAAEIAVELLAAKGSPEAWVDAEVDVRESARGVCLEGSAMRAEIDAGAGRARIAASGPGPIDVLFRFLLATHLSARGGLLVHASAVERDGGAWVFPGPSGAGKTTLATHLPGRRVCDETVALIAQESRVTVHSTPYWRATPRAATVAGLAFPRRTSEPVWRPLSPARAAARLVGSTGPLLERTRPRALELAAAVTTAVQCADLGLSSIADITAWLPSYL